MTMVTIPKHLEWFSYDFLPLFTVPEMAGSWRPREYRDGFGYQPRPFYDHSYRGRHSGYYRPRSRSRSRIYRDWNWDPDLEGNFPGGINNRQQRDDYAPYKDDHPQGPYWKPRGILSNSSDKSSERTPSREQSDRWATKRRLTWQDRPDDRQDEQTLHKGTKIHPHVPDRTTPVALTRSDYYPFVVSPDDDGQPIGPIARASETLLNLLRASHHQNAVHAFTKGGIDPPGFDKLIHELANNFMPSSPSAYTHQLLTNNAKQYVTGCYTILDQHYASSIESNTLLLQGMLCYDWDTAWLRAIQQARRHLGRELIPAVVESVMALIPQESQSSGPSLDPPISPNFMRPSIDRPSTYHPTTAALRHKTTNKASGSEAGRMTPQGRPLTPDNTITAPTFTRGDPLNSVTIPVVQDVERTLATAVKAAVPTRTQAALGTANIRAHSTPKEPPNSGFALLPATPANIELPPSLDPFDSPDPPAEMMAVSPPLKRCKPGMSALSQLLLLADSPNSPPDNEQPSTSTASRGDLTPPSHTIHAEYTERENWGLNLSKPVVILGDQNLRSMTVFPTNVQVDVYPHARIADVTTVLKALPNPSDIPRKVLISVGLNNRDRGSSAVLSKALQLMYDTAVAKFPKAMIFVPKITYGPTFTAEEQDRILALNLAIGRLSHSIPSVPISELPSVCDLISWSPEAARIHLAHWARFVPFPLGNLTQVNHITVHIDILDCLHT